MVDTIEPDKPNFSKPAELVTLKIGRGDDQEDFSVHKEFACHASPVLRAAFNGPFIEGITQTYKLDNVQPAVFRLFVQRLYNQPFSIHSRLAGEFAENDPTNSAGWTASEIGDWIGAAEGDDYARLPKQVDNTAIESPDLVEDIDGYDEEGFILPDAAEYEQDMRLIQLWILADRLIMPDLQNMVMFHLLKMDRDYWSTHWINHVYKHTSSESPLRRFALDLCLYTVPGNYFRSHPDEFPHALLVELIGGIKSKDGMSNIFHSQDKDGTVHGSYGRYNNNANLTP